MVLGFLCRSHHHVMISLEVDWQSFKHVRVYLPLVPYIKYINNTTIIHKNRPKNTRIIMPLIPVANQAIRNRPAKFQKNPSETSQDFNG